MAEVNLTYGVHGTADTLATALRSYIEAQYHIHNEAAIMERRALLEEAGSVMQVPYVESTPIYELGLAYDKLHIPHAVSETLVRLSKENVGIYPTPYVHQARALEKFFGEPSADLIVATGTGSGKTESFLMPIIGQLALESARNPKVGDMPGCRALLLYPMNALVNDQNSRVRRLFGSEAASKIISAGRNRPVRFATYTSRTPYPGPRSARRDRERLAPLFESFYLPLLEQPEKVDELQAIGQWPAKDLQGFFGASEEELRSSTRGERRFRHWDRRLVTQPFDRELLTRHEVQMSCPDILITNYSMLEYMLMRPIERDIFSQTREWLKADLRNELIVVLDEAHMYRGAGGAEVALLLRRLSARLEVPRGRVRYILTSASLGDGAEAKDRIRRFASDLTGLVGEDTQRFALIVGQRELRAGARCGEVKAADALASLDLAAFERHAERMADSRSAVEDIARQLGWDELRSDDDLADYLFRMLTGFGPLELLVELASGNAMPLPELEEALFPGCPTAARATASLIALATYARRAKDGRVLLPTRLHMFFRGLPGLYACADLNCPDRRVTSSEGAVVGRLHTHAREACGCGARVYEFLTHRECGAAFLRGYMSNPHGDFVWHMSSGQLREGHQLPLVPVDLLVEAEPHADQLENCVQGWLDLKSGRLVYEAPSNPSGFRQIYMPDPNDSFDRSGVRFLICPVCGGRCASNIMDHATKGEAPFANLVKRQLEIQPPTREEDRTFPNGGRKVLLFSDGRQKAARLARDIPREVEQDIFRQVLALAASKLVDIGHEAKIDRRLYIGFLTVLRDFNLPMFDRHDALEIENRIERLEKDHEGEKLEDILVEFDAGTPPPRYFIGLLKQLCGRHYSIMAATIGYLNICKKALARTTAAISTVAPKLSSGQIEELALTWVARAAERYALDRSIPEQLRYKASGFWSEAPGVDGKFGRTLRGELPRILGVSATCVEKIENALCAELALADQTGGYLLDPAKLKLVIALTTNWYRCNSCKTLRPFKLCNCCSVCGAADPEDIDPVHSEYVRARKGFWRQPVYQVLASGSHLRGISVEEHTAQLSNRDNASIYSTTEHYELRFRDIRIEPRDRPIDVLSCTTTMEVGVDIGSLVAVGLRNVPPQRENYQQRAGRAGRRGASVSSVVTYAQNGPHDSYYYHKPADIVAGSARNPDVKTDNPKIARRHINSFLLQTFFHGFMDEHQIAVGGRTSALFRALGVASDFYYGDTERVPTFSAFVEWLEKEVLDDRGYIRSTICGWLPSNLRIAPLAPDQWIVSVVQDLITKLRMIGRAVHKPQPAEADEEADGERTSTENPELLDLLFDSGLLPTYAFPTDLTSFLIERLQSDKNLGRRRTQVVERPQQGIQKALTEYAPGRLIVINKETYRSGGVVADVLPTNVDRAAPLFDNEQTLIHCDNCNYIGDVGLELSTDDRACPVCGAELQRSQMIVPQVFTPEDGRALDEDDREQEITYATGAQFPVPVDGDDIAQACEVGEHATFVVAADQRLVITNRGQMLDGRYGGFWVCERCGRATLIQPEEESHRRPYPIEPSFSLHQPPSRCNGIARNVFLGHVFSTDLLLLRISISAPLNTDTHDLVALRALEDGLYSVAEALRLIASRHPQLDLDPSELGSGFRIVPARRVDQVHLDLYLFDTLSGGAGYSELAGRFLPEILVSALELLESCPADCDRSCESCLRHYYNQYLKQRLDRHLGALLLRYGVHGQVPKEAALQDQIRKLGPLRRLLELDGFDCDTSVTVDGVTVPLLVRRKGESVLVGVKQCLVQQQTHSLDRLASRHNVVLLNDYILARNLPDEHQLVRNKFSIVS